MRSSSLRLQMWRLSAATKLSCDSSRGSIVPIVGRKAGTTRARGGRFAAANCGGRHLVAAPLRRAHSGSATAGGGGRPPASSLESSSQAPSSSGAAKETGEKTDRLFKELNELMEKRQAKVDERNSKSWLESAGEFFRSSRHQVINIGATFFCLLMAMQVADGRIARRKLRSELGNAEATVDDLHRRMDELKSEEFAKEAAKKINAALESGTAEAGENNGDAGETAGTSGNDRRFFGLIQRANERRSKLANNDGTADGVVASVLRSEISAVIGEASLTSEEMKQREIDMLHSYVVGSGDGDVQLNPAAKALAAAVSEEEEESKESKEGGSVTVLKKRKIMF